MSKFVVCKYIPFKGFIAMNFFGIIIVREEYLDIFKEVELNHEQIHTAQMKELGYIFFYLIYLFEWIFKGFSYRSISFEKEAYSHEKDLNYLEYRRPFAQWFNYL